jgi:chromosome partitioning protein
MPGEALRNKVILCTHHKGGAGKTELAIHITGVLLEKPVGQVAFVNCDSQTDGWRFFTKREPRLDEKFEPVRVSDRLRVIYNPDRKSIVEKMEGIDHFVIDVHAALPDTVKMIVQEEPDLVLIPVDRQYDSLVNLADALMVIAQLGKAGATPRVRIVPLGGPSVQEINKRLAELVTKPSDCQVMPRIRPLQSEATRARKQRRYIWKDRTCRDLLGYYAKLLET